MIPYVLSADYRRPQTRSQRIRGACTSTSRSINPMPARSSEKADAGHRGVLAADRVSGRHGPTDSSLVTVAASAVKVDRVSAGSQPGTSARGHGLDPLRVESRRHLGQTKERKLNCKPVIRSILAACIAVGSTKQITMRS